MARVRLLRVFYPPTVVNDNVVADDGVPVPTGKPNEFVGDRFCKFIYGNIQKAWMCCGSPVHQGKGSWCTSHRKVVFEVKK